MQQNIARVTLRKEATRNAYNRMGRFYDMLAGRLERKHMDEGLQMLGISGGETILEIGFGIGHAIVAMSRSAGGSGKVYGIDISDRMVEIAGHRVNKAKMANRVMLQRGDAVELPYKDAFFDAIFISFTLELFDTPEMSTVLQHCRRVLKDDGRICVLSLSKQREDLENEGFMPRMYMLLHRALPRYAGCRPIVLRKILEDAGFRTIDVVERSMFGLPITIVSAYKT